jgi:hypothetical protein
LIESILAARLNSSTVEFFTEQSPDNPFAGRQSSAVGARLLLVVEHQPVRALLAGPSHLADCNDWATAVGFMVFVGQDFKRRNSIDASNLQLLDIDPQAWFARMRERRPESHDSPSAH